MEIVLIIIVAIEAIGLVGLTIVNARQKNIHNKAIAEMKKIKKEHSEKLQKEISSRDQSIVDSNKKSRDLEEKLQNALDNIASIQGNNKVLENLKKEILGIRNERDNLVKELSLQKEENGKLRVESEKKKENPEQIDQKKDKISQLKKDNKRLENEKEQLKLFIATNVNEKLLLLQKQNKLLEKQNTELMQQMVEISHQLSVARTRLTHQEENERLQVNNLPDEPVPTVPNNVELVPALFKDGSYENQLSELQNLSGVKDFLVQSKYEKANMYLKLIDTYIEELQDAFENISEEDDDEIATICIDKFAKCFEQYLAEAVIESVMRGVDSDPFYKQFLGKLYMYLEENNIFSKEVKVGDRYENMSFMNSIPQKTTDEQKHKRIEKILSLPFYARYSNEYGKIKEKLLCKGSCIVLTSK